LQKEKGMSSTEYAGNDKEDVLEQYVSNVRGLHEKISKISSHHREIIDSMERIKRALYTIGQAHRH
jgi:hypothetical protein